MVKLTRSNVAHDLNISPHKLGIVYNDSDHVEFVFSSELYKEKFREKMQLNRETINQSLTNRFGFSIIADKLADFRLYTTIEKRGFLIYHNGVKAECLNDITLDGQKLIIST